VDIAGYLDAISRDSAAIAAAARAGLDRPVPSCPGWQTADLVGHVGQLGRWFTLLVQASPDERVRFRDVPDPPEGDALVSWLEEGSGVLLAALERTDPDDEVHTWAGPQPARWVFRRLANEIAVHRWDAQTAIGNPSPITTALAIDGIDEVFEVFVPAVPPERLAGEGQTMHLHAADAEGEWLVTFTPDGLAWEHGHIKADVAARGAASDLLLLLWNRVGADELEVFGDADVLDRWQRGFAI
jgi:uncharacterized protein (TIGR03083 family)